MPKIDSFTHVLPRRYLDRLTPQLERSMRPAPLRYYRQGGFSA